MKGDHEQDKTQLKAWVQAIIQLLKVIYLVVTVHSPLTLTVVFCETNQVVLRADTQK